MTEFVVITTSTGTIENARLIAARLVTAGSAACVHILPIESYYRWKGELQHDHEHVLQIKTSSSHVSNVQSCIKLLHSYELPEILITPVIGGSEPYLGWMREQMTKA